LIQTYCYSLSLLEHAAAQHLHLFLSEEAPVATTYVLLGQSGELHAVELHDAIAQALEDTSHDTVLTAVDLDTYLAVVTLVGILNSVGMYLAILQLNALSDLLQILGSHVLVEEYMVDLLLEELRMGQLAGKLTVVGQQQHTGGVAVQTTYRIDALGTCVLHEIHHRLALLGIVAGSDIILRLIEQHIYFLLKCDRLIVELHDIGAEHLGAELGDDLIVDRHHTSLNELISLTTRADTGICQIFVQTNRLVRIDILLLVLDTLLHAILSIGIVSWTVLSIATLTVVATLALLTIATLLTITALLTIATLLTRLIASLSLLTIAALLTRLIATLSLLAVTALLARLITTLLTGLVAALLTGLVATLLTGLIATLLARLITTLALLITTLLVIVVVARTLLIATLALLIAALALLVAALTLLIAVAGTLLVTHQASTEALGTEAAALVTAGILVRAESALCMNTWTLYAAIDIISLITLLWTIAFTACIATLLRLCGRILCVLF
jgi:hypothetical protein